MKINRIMSFLNHRRIVLFWLVAGLGVTAPWVLSAGGSSAERLLQDDLQTCTVMNVYDGDTITVKCDGKRQKVRLYCIDAPEMSQRPWGRESRDYLRNSIPRGAKISVREKAIDRYGRRIGEVWSDGRLINLVMVEEGRAVNYPAYCHEKKYKNAETTARNKSLGIWVKSGKHQYPWEYRRTK